MLKKIIEGIYIITNTITNKVYIGQSKNIKSRFYEHKYNLRKNRHTNSHLQNAFNIDGENAFEFAILEECSQELRNEREIYWIDYYKSTDSNFGYNYQSGGCSRQTIADETKQKIIKALTGREVSEETRKKIGDANRGRKASKELSEELSIQRKGRTPWNKGKKMTPEQKLSHSIGMSKRKPRVHSEETKRKISEAQKGKPRKSIPRTEEWKKKISESNKGRTYSEETKQRMSEGQKGKTLSDKTKCKIGEASKKMWAERRLNKK